MQKETSGKGSTLHIVIMAIVIVLVAGTVTLKVVGHKESSSGNSTKTMAKTKQQSRDANSIATDPSNGGKYLYISEWQVRSLLPNSLAGKVTYQLGSSVIDPDGNQIQNAKVFISKSALSGGSCASSTTKIGEAVDSGAQYIKSESSKPFNTGRYKGSFKENILETRSNNYHLNYVTPQCLDQSNEAVITELQEALVKLETIH